MSWPNGKKYDGEFLNDKKDGYGVFTWENGRQYLGYWHQGYKNGVGMYVNEEGEENIGLWQDGYQIKWFTHDEYEIEKAKSHPWKEVL